MKPLWAFLIEKELSPDIAMKVDLIYFGISTEAAIKLGDDLQMENIQKINDLRNKGLHFKENVLVDNREYAMPIFHPLNVLIDDFERNMLKEFSISAVSERVDELKSGMKDIKRQVREEGMAIK